MTQPLSQTDTAERGAQPFPLRLEDAHICVVGLGYVGLPVAVAFGQIFPTVGIDIRAARVESLKIGHDETLEATPDELEEANRLSLTFAWDSAAACKVFTVNGSSPLSNPHHPPHTPP